MRTIHQVVFVLLPVVIGAMHLFFFLFYPRARENLFFAVFMFCWAYAVFTDYESAFWTNTAIAIAVERSIVFAISGAFVFGLLSMYSGTYAKLPNQFYGIAGLSLGVGIWGFLQPTQLPVAYLLYGIMGIIAFEVFRIFFKQWRAGSRQRWITAVGVVVFLLVTKGMPLGGFSEFLYQTKKVSLSAGDVVLLMSDGFLEMFNTEDETLDEARAIEVTSTLRRTVLLRAILLLIVSGMILFLPAGTFAYWQAWVWIAIWFIPASLLTAHYLKTDPALIERRMRMKEKEKAQRDIMNVAFILFIVAFIIPGFDKRYGWSFVPLPSREY